MTTNPSAHGFSPERLRRETTGDDERIGESDRGLRSYGEGPIRSRESYVASQVRDIRWQISMVSS